MLSKSKKWLAVLIAFLLVLTLAVFAACRVTITVEDDEDDKTDVPPTEDVPDTPDEPDEDEGDFWANYDWGTIEYQLQTYCIGHSEWGLISLYEDGAVRAYGRMIQDLSNYGMTGYQITRTYIYGNWSIVVDRDDITTMYINYTYIEDYDSGEGRAYEKTLTGIEGLDGNITFNTVTIPMYMPQYGMLYDVCTTDDEWTYFLDSSSFVDVGDIDAADAYFDELGELRGGDTVDTGNGGVTVVLATFTATGLMGGEVYAYLYSDGSAEINNDYFASTGTWMYFEGTLVIVNSNGTDMYYATIDGNTATFDYESYGMAYTFVCDDISALLDGYIIVLTFTATGMMGGEVYAYLYSNGRADINNDFFASTCSWMYEDGVLLLINDNGTDEYEVTIDGNTATFDYSSMGMSYTFVCDDISSFLELF